MRKITLILTLCLVAALPSLGQEPAFTQAEIDSILNDTLFKQLSEVEVKAIRPLIKAEIDRLAYDVQGDGDAKTSTVIEMLRKVPLVTVDAEDNIRVKGATNFKIYKNGHPDPTLSSNPKEVLRAIPASMIKRIEVITEPGAKYDAEGVGAILNIVMNDTGSMNGVTGTVSAGIDNTASPNASAYLTTQVGRWVTSLNYGLSHRNRHAQSSHGEALRQYNDGHQLHNDFTLDARTNVHYGNIESSFEADKRNLFTLSFGGFYYDYAGNLEQQWRSTDAVGNQLYRYNETIKLPQNRYYNLNGRLGYEHKTHTQGEALTLSYLLSTSRNQTARESSYHDMENMPADYSGTYNHGKANFWEHTWQFDWTRPFAMHNTIETGLKYIYRLNKSNNRFAYNSQGLDPNITLFNHTTQVGAAYASYTYRRDRWSARAGLRYEWSRLSGKYPDGSKERFSTHLSDWVPSMSVNYQISMAQSVKLAFSTHISRPGIDYLNPAIIETPTSINYGNTQLKSSRNYSVSLTYMFISPKVTFSLVPSYMFSNNGITAVQFRRDGKDHTTYSNTLNNRRLGLNAFMQWQVTGTTSLMVNGNINHNRLHSSDRQLTNKKWGSFAFAQLTQQLPWKLRLTANAGEWTGGGDDLYSKSTTVWWYGLGLQRSFLPQDRLTVRLNAQRPFSGKYSMTRQDIVQGDYTGFSKSFFPSRNFSITVSYRFGSLRAQVKKTSSTIDNDDVVGGSSGTGQNSGQQTNQQTQP